jgi:glycosyltransferase involved in cell wall biosynthesis
MRVQLVSKGPIEQISGGYLYNRYLMGELRGAGIEVGYRASPRDLNGLSRDDVVIVDSLVIAEAAPQLLTLATNIVLLLHVLPDPHAIGDDGETLLDALYRRSRVVVTGNSSLAALRERLSATGIDAVKIEPGVPLKWHRKHSYSAHARRLLGVANYIPGKGVDRLLDVLASLRHLPWNLTVRGNPYFDPFHFRSLQRRIGELGLSNRVELLGPVPHAAINDEMLSADLLVHFSQHETYSMVTAEAIACGLPVLSYRTGNADVFGSSGLVRYLDDGAPEAPVLAALIEDRGTYSRLRQVGRRDTRTWRDVGREFIAWLGTD